METSVSDIASLISQKNRELVEAASIIDTIVDDDEYLLAQEVIEVLQKEPDKNEKAIYLLQKSINHWEWLCKK